MPPITLNNRYKYNPDTDLLGTGGLGAVYKAYDVQQERYVAIKKFNAADSLRYSLKAEFQKSIHFSHGNLVRAYDFFSITFTDPIGETHETQYGVMELIAGGDLAKYLKTKPPLPELLEVVKGILRGLAYLHTPDPNTDKGIVIHRDIKPANILIFRNKEGKPIPKIADFNIAKENTHTLSTVTVVGTPEYMSPEQILPNTYAANGKLLPNTDLWALGVLLCEHLLNKSIFGKRTNGLTPGEITHNVLNHPLPTTDIQNLSAPFNQIVAQCLVRDAQQRIQSAKELLRVIDGYENLVEETIIEETPTPPKPKLRVVPEDTYVPNTTETVKPAATKNNTPTIVTGVVLLCLLLGYWFYPTTHNESEKVPTETTTQNATDPFATQMVLIQGGTFTMGSNDTEASDDEKPNHSVTLDDFYMGKYEVTQAQWKAVMGTSDTLSNPSYFKGDDLPVENVSWSDVQVFLTKLNQMTGKNYRLPTEAEWEYAARGGNKSKGYTYAGSDFSRNWDTVRDEVAWYDDNSASTTHTVGQKKPNELGLYDMSGNVHEWCQDWYDSDYYKKSPANNPTGPTSGASRVLRGGSWRSQFFFSDDCRVDNRSGNTPGIRFNTYGFRLVFAP